MANFEEVVQTLIDTNNKLLKGEIKLEVARHIASSTQVLINAARLEFDIFKVTKNIPKFLKEEEVEKSAPPTIQELKTLAEGIAAENKPFLDDVDMSEPFFNFNEQK